MGTTWERHAWYLRLPSTRTCLVRPGRASYVAKQRPTCPAGQLTALANLSQTALCRYASVAYKDSRAPQNLVPIAGLENVLRHRLGDTRVLYRTLREAAH